MGPQLVEPTTELGGLVNSSFLIWLAFFSLCRRSLAAFCTWKARRLPLPDPTSGLEVSQGHSWTALEATDKAAAQGGATSKVFSHPPLPWNCLADKGDFNQVEP